ncbi:MAG: sigma-70 family RNA polymerase sigma factor [Rhizomicrobium sp.]
MADEEPDSGFWVRALKQVVRRTHGNPDAEDLLHAAYLRLEAYRAQQPVTQPIGFLVRTAVNLSIDEHRRASRNVEDGETHILTVVDDGPLADEVIAARERLRRVKQGLEKMPARRREIFLMHRIGGLTYRQIAVQVGLSQSMIEKEMAKAILFLTEWMDGWQ